MNRTSIEWVKNPDGSQGYSWNPITGCLNGCPYCFARKLANTRLKERYLSNRNFIAETDITPKTDPFYPRFWPDKLDQPLKRKKPVGIFTCDMSDLFGIGVPEQWTWSVLNFIKECPQHRFYLLTKQSQNLIKFSPFPDNCWVGVTTTNQEMYVKAFWELNRIEAKVKYLSFEPLLEKIELTPSFARHVYQWVIIGAQTKPYKPPKIEWVKEITEACDKAGIPVFHKENLKPIFPKPTSTLRQEFPV